MIIVKKLICLLVLSIEYNKKNHSGINSNNYIQDNIGNFDQFTLNYSLVYDTTNDIFYPTDGILIILILKFLQRNFR